MITQAEAKKIAEDYLESKSKITGYNLAFLWDNTKEFEYGWAFIYQSKEYIETGDMRHMLGGNSPIIINKYDSSISVTGTAHRLDYYLNEYVEKMKMMNK
jgi:long-subunit fatty acid transport protein